jgi:energy-coupling factor transporter ATP-binding protein EcfA2
MTFQIEKATKTAAKGRIAIEGPAGSGKTYTSLILATVLAEEGRIIFIDSEKRSSEKYADIFDFDILPLEPPYTVKKYTEAIRFASELDGYDVVIVDSLSHAWAGEGGALEQVDTAKSKYQGNTYVAWRDVTPDQHRMVEAILQNEKHIICCMRSKTEFSMEKDSSGKTTIRKLGLQPVQREGLDYEFDVVFAMDWDHRAIVTKTRMASLADQVFVKPGPDVGQLLKDWLTAGEARPEEPVVEAAEADAIIEALEEEQAQRSFTQGDLVALAQQRYGFNGSDVGAALKAQNITAFDVEKWDEMVDALEQWNETQQEAAQAHVIE